MRNSFQVSLTTLLFTASLVAQIATPPAASVRPVNDNYFGTSITDNYRWMEDLKSPELIAWMKGQNDYTRSLIDRIPGHTQLQAEITKYDNARTTVDSLQVFSGRYFYRKILPGEENFKLYMRDATSGQERMLVDPERFRSGDSKAHFALDYFSASWDGKYVAYGVSPGGSEESVLRVIDVDTGRDFTEAIDRANFGVTSWMGDSRSFFYVRLQKLGPNDPPTAKYLNSRIYLHKVGDDPGKDVSVLGRGVTPQVEISESDFPVVSYSPTSPWLVGTVRHGVQNEFPVYVAKLSELAGAKTPWKKAAGDDDDVNSYDVHGDKLFLMTHRDASRYKVVSVQMDNPDFASAKVVLPAGEVVLRNIQVAKDGLYVQELDGGIGKVARVPLVGGKPEPVSLPSEGSIAEMFTHPLEPGAWVLTESWVQPPTYLRVGTGMKTVDPQLIPKPAFDYSDLESVEVKVPAPDGTMIPLSIVHKHGLQKDGLRATFLEGYGSYGITLDPAFVPRFIPWLERGGIFAVAHIRGGGEYGEDWHNAGRKLAKQNTIGDFIACAEYLVKNNYTSRAHLAGEGGSAGGITVGGAITQRPDLFAVILDDVGLSDALRFETTPNGPPNIPEFGSTKTEEGFKGLYGMDAYVHVKDGTAYPAVMLTTGINDPRVDSWQAAKMAARLQASTSSGKPILLRVDYDAGHGFGSGRAQRDQLLSDEQSFALWQFGDAEFQPTK
jgi:prolyl oligopeptidase